MGSGTLREELRAGSAVAETARGTVEFARCGSGPVVLALHGGPGGYDQSLLAYCDLCDHGFSLLAPSRPGYLRTPLGAGRTYEEQADAMIALLDSLGIERVAVAGISAGGPCALQIALRHPKRLWAMLLESAVTKRYTMNPDKTANAWITALFLTDMGISVMNLIARHWPKLIVRQLIETESYLDRAPARELLRHVMGEPSKVEFVQKLMISLTPFLLRKPGLDNDLIELARIGEWPLETISAPTLIAHGTKDADVLYSHAEYAAGRIPGARLLSVVNGTHLLPLDPEWPLIREKEISFLEAHVPLP
jgi:pimeloyl-ACP methyl ester carboxylesterase